MDPDPHLISILFLNTDLISILSIFSLAILLICSALISGTEVAFFSLSQTELTKLTQATKGESLVALLLERPKKLLATILITNNFINILIVLIFASVGDTYFSHLDYTINIYFTEVSVRFLIEVLLVTSLILLFGEVLPKVYASRKSVEFALFMAKPIGFLNSLCTPFSIPLIKLTKVVEKRLGSKSSDISVETLSQVLELTSDTTTTKEEQKILQGIVSFGSTETVQIMKPRIDIFAISTKDDFQTVVANIQKHGYSRNPVYEESIDQIIGVLYAKDLLAHLDKKDFDWTKILREPYFVPENKKLDDLLGEFRLKKNHLAIVVDEYGGTSGIVTLEDVIEEIVGDINDEFDDDDVFYSKIDNDNYIFEGKVSIKDFCRILDGIEEEDLEEAKGESETLAGFILEIHGKFPRKLQVIKFRNFSFTIEAMDKKRIKQVKVTRLHA